MGDLHSLSDARPDRPGRLEVHEEVISPELVLVDPDLAVRARALLPWPEPALPQPRPVVEVAAPEPRPAAAEAPARRAEPPLQFGRRLVAAATLVPMLVTLALIAEFFGRSASPLGATTTSQSSSRTGSQRDLRGHRLDALLAQRGSTLRSLEGLPGPPTSRRRSGGHCVARWRSEGLTLVFAARAPKDPCSEGRLVAGYATPSG